jgi:hypothetical protein
MSDLTDRERQMLDFESGRHWTYAGAKEQEIRRLFDMTATRYYQALNALLDRPEALMYAPATVKRLCRLREARKGARGHLRTRRGVG